MLNLVLKDVRIQKKSFLYACFYGIFVMFVFGLGGGDLAAGVYTMGVVASTYIFVQNGAAIDDKNNSAMILNSLPIKRSEIVVAKYISSVLFSLLNLLLMAVIGFIFANIFTSQIRYINLGDVVVALTSTWILIAVFLPLNFKFGFIKAKIFNMFIFFLFFFGPTTLIAIINQNAAHPISQFLQSIAGNDANGVSGIILLAFITILLLSSLPLSLKVYGKRDF